MFTMYQTAHLCDRGHEHSPEATASGNGNNDDACLPPCAETSWRHCPQHPWHCHLQLRACWHLTLWAKTKDLVPSHLECYYHCWFLPVPRPGKTLLLTDFLSQKLRFNSSSIGHPPNSSASPVELRLRVGTRSQCQWKKRSKGERGVEICPSVCLEHSKGEEAWGEKVEGIIK